MADRISTNRRSQNMAAIKGKNTSIEQYICHELFRRGYRYRKNVSYIPGHPDLYLKKYNTAIFVNGCFWHRHENCRYAYNPKTREEFWEKKFNTNIERDAKVKQMLIEKGIKCIIVWECTVKKMKKDAEYKDMILDEIELFMSTDNLFMEL